MAWRGDSWADIVARAAKMSPHAKSGAIEPEDRASLAARARPWTFSVVRLVCSETGLTIGADLDSIDVAWAQLYHVEPIDPWPSLALGWVDRGESYRTELTPPPEQDPRVFAATVEAIVTRHGGRPTAASPGWLRHPVLEWERVDAMPDERDEGPAMRGYRMAPEVADPVVARRKTAPGIGRFLGWIWASLRHLPHRIDAIEVVLTRQFVYARTRRGERLRLPVSALRTAHRTTHGDAVYVLGRSTELLLLGQDDCPVARALDARLKPTEVLASEGPDGGA